MKNTMKKIIEKIFMWWIGIPFAISKNRKNYSSGLNDLILRMTLKVYEKNTDYYFA